MFFISYGARMGPVRDPQGCRTAALRTRKGIHTIRIGKTPARASYLAVRAPYGLFPSCLWTQNPYGARKLIMHALKLYGPRTGRQNSYGAPVSGRTVFVQNSPGTARTGPGGVMWLRHKSGVFWENNGQHHEITDLTHWPLGDFDEILDNLFSCIF